MLYLFFINNRLEGSHYRVLCKADLYTAVSIKSTYGSLGAYDPDSHMQNPPVILLGLAESLLLKRGHS